MEAIWKQGVAQSVYYPVFLLGWNEEDILRESGI